MFSLDKSKSLSLSNELGSTCAKNISSFSNNVDAKILLKILPDLFLPYQLIPQFHQYHLISIYL